MNKKLDYWPPARLAEMLRQWNPGQIILFKWTGEDVVFRCHRFFAFGLQAANDG